MRPIFLDTVGLIALWDRRDQWHAAARQAWDAIDLDATRLVTSSFILLECGNHAARKPYRGEVIALRDDLGMAGDLYQPTPDEVADAWDHYARSVHGTASVIDLTSFAIMRRLGITEAFTNDRHFQAAGFVTLF